MPYGIAQLSVHKSHTECSGQLFTSTDSLCYYFPVISLGNFCVVSLRLSYARSIHWLDILITSSVQCHLSVLWSSKREPLTLFLWHSLESVSFFWWWALRFLFRDVSTPAQSTVSSFPQLSLSNQMQALFFHRMWICHIRFPSTFTSFFLGSSSKST